ncbi:hypothetical protein ACFY7Y_33365 [Streptomyces virginiae]|uniref:hypothetical protein n=2 Tax=Streptomyces TaxID=1883 RepID=UPI0036AC93A9
MNTPMTGAHEITPDPASGQDASAPVPMAAAIAQTVGAVLAQSAALTAPSTTVDADEIRAITDAMIRLLIGVPCRSDGQLTVKSLAAEAGLRRNKLTHKHTGLRDLFYALVRAQDVRPKIADSLKADNDTLRKQVSRLRADRDAQAAQTAQLVRVIQVLELENLQLRESADTTGVIRVLAPRGH